MGTSDQNRMAESNYPLSAARVPDAETEARTFISKYPQSDGRGIVIAIIDTGIDPGAPGLQVTSDGKPKVIDVVDTTGAGDVDTSKKAAAGSEEHTVVGVTGRTLHLNPGWDNPAGEWRVGTKLAYELFDPTLVSRLKGERRQATSEQQRGLVSAARNELTAFLKTNSGPLFGEKKKELEELEAKKDLLEQMDKDYEDPGPVLDVLTWCDSSDVWRVVVGECEDGQLADLKVLASFAIERQMGFFGEASQMNYAVNVYDNGDIVSIVCDASSHGTHVAGITAACHPDAPELNGVAPGAQLVSIKIGDIRLDSLETGTGLIRGFAHCVEMGVDLINLSFGESSSPA